MIDHPEAPSEQEIAELCARPLPTTITVQVTQLTAIALMASAYSDDRTPEYIAKRILEEWGRGRLEAARHYQRVLREDGVISTPEPRKKTEHAYRVELADAIELLGWRVQTELDTGAGDADIAVFAPGQQKPLVIIEVKLSLTGWREVHQASGQARAYAKAAGAKLWFVTAPTIDPRFVSEQVVPIDGAAALVVAVAQARVTA